MPLSIYKKPRRPQQFGTQAPMSWLERSALDRLKAQAGRKATALKTKKKKKK